MGYMLLSVIRLTCADFRRLIISYDIACQFSKNFAKRMADFPVDFRIDVTEKEIIMVVPKFHLAGHGRPCQVIYSLNYTTGVGRTYGEGIEANWSETNTVSLASREMPAGARHEFLNDIFGAINWRKLTTLGTDYLFHRYSHEYF